jgi:hypothetical protein
MSPSRADDFGHADPDRHEEEAGRRCLEGEVYNAKDGQNYSSTIKPVGTDQPEIQGLRARLPVRRETWDPRRPPIPSSPANSMAKVRRRLVGAPPKPPLRHRCRRRPRARSIRAPRRGRARSEAGASVRPPISAISAYPDIARFAH